MTGELYLAYYYMAGMRYVALRYANVYGPRQSAKARQRGGNFHFPAACWKASHHQRRWQADARLCFVGNVVKANVAALETSHVGGINIGTGRETDVVDPLPGCCSSGPLARSNRFMGRRKPASRCAAASTLPWPAASWLAAEIGLEEGVMQIIACYREKELSES